MSNFPPYNPQRLEEMMKQQQAMLESVKAYNERENDALKKYFSGKIKQNFLIEMKELVIHHQDMNILMGIYDVMKITADNMLLGKDNLIFDACKFITMFHFFNTIVLDDQKRASAQNDKNYKEELCNQVVEAMKLKKVGLVYNGKNNLETYYPLTYSINSLNNYLLFQFNNIIYKDIHPKTKNGDFKSQMLFKMMNKVKAILLLLDNNLIEECFNPLRSLIELFMIYHVLYDANKKSIEKYNEHIKYQFEYQKTQDIPEAITMKTNELKEKGCKLSRIDYLNFGWLDSVLQYNYINENERKYKIVDIAELLNMMYERENKGVGSLLYKFYRECSPLSHGFNGFLNYYSSKQTILERVCYLLSFIAVDFEKLYETHIKYNDIDLVDYMQEYYNKQLKYDEVINSNEKLYNELNQYYINKIK